MSITAAVLPRTPQDETPPEISIKSYKPAPQDLDSDPSATVSLPDTDDYRWVINLSTHHQEQPHSNEHLSKLGSPQLTLPHPLPAFGGGGSSGSVEFITVQPFINQEIVDVRQLNVLLNNDDASAGPTELPLQPFDILPVLAPMLVDAQKSVPVDLLPEEGNSSSVLEFVNNRDAHPAETGQNAAPYTVSSGLYVDGEIRDPATATEVHQLTNDKMELLSTGLESGRVEPIPQGDNPDIAIQKITLGDNISANQATIFSDSGLCGSMLVLGNYHQTEAIFQTNVLAQSDHFEVGTGDESGISYISNLAHNIADISTTGAIEGPWLVGGPLSWSVQVLEGSLYDVKCMSQTNFISDNDVVSQTQSFGYSFVLAGSNEQVNTIDFQSAMGQWDLVVIEGSYHRLDMINQTNVVLDMNHVSQDWTGSGADSGNQSIIAGNNALLNDATVIYVGATGSLGVTDSMVELAKVLAANDGAPDSSLIASAFPNLMGTVHVLYVQGDYYNINYLSQTNVISDADVAAQLLTSEGTGEQTVSTGNNLAINAATIVDTGSLTTPYVQGASYSDTILIQTNIIATDSKVVTNDPTKLVPEVVAFTGTDATDHHQDAPQLFAPPPQDSQQHSGDLLSGTLH